MAFMGLWGTGVEPGTQYTEKVSCTVWKMMMMNSPVLKHTNTKKVHGRLSVACVTRTRSHASPCSDCYTTLYNDRVLDTKCLHIVVCLQINNALRYARQSRALLSTSYKMDSDYHHTFVLIGYYHGTDTDTCVTD